MASLESMHNGGKVRKKQARRMIAATLQNTEREKIIFFFHQFTLWCESADVSLLFFFFSSSPLFHHASSQMARRQTSQGRPMKTSISLRVHWNCTWGICLFPSSHMMLTQGSSRLQVSHTGSVRNTPILVWLVWTSTTKLYGVFLLHVQNALLGAHDRY